MQCVACAAVTHLHNSMGNSKPHLTFEEDSKGKIVSTKEMGRHTSIQGRKEGMQEGNAHRMNRQ